LADTPEKDSQRKIPGEGEAVFLEGPSEILERETREQNKRDEEYKERQLRISERLAVLTLCLVIGTGVYDCLMWYQSKTARIAADAAQESAAAANNAARIAGNTLIASQNSFKQEQRAYLWASSFNMSNPPTCPDSRGVHVCADVHVVNSGKTPANGVHIWRYAIFGPNAERTIKAMKVPEYKTPSGDVLGLSGDKWGTAFTPVVDNATASSLIDGTISLYIYGVVQYFDIFGEYHETGFCSQRVQRGTAFIVCDGSGNWFDKKPEQKPK
jgi:hypothetical protein